MALDWHGIHSSSIDSNNSPDALGKVRNMLNSIDTYLHDNAAAIRRLSAGTPASTYATTTIGVTDHGALTGLSDDDHTGYAWLLGRAAGQVLLGCRTASDTPTVVHPRMGFALNLVLAAHGDASSPGLFISKTSSTRLYSAGSLLLGTNTNVVTLSNETARSTTEYTDLRFLGTISLSAPDFTGTNRGSPAISVGNRGVSTALQLLDESTGVTYVANKAHMLAIDVGTASNGIPQRTALFDELGQLQLGATYGTRTSTTATLFTTARTASTPALITQGYTSQTANLQEWQDSAATVLAYVDKDGNASFAGMTLPSATLTLLTLEGADPGAYDGASGLLFNNSNDGFNVQVVVNPGQTADRILRLPSDADGILITTSATQTISSKTLNTTNTLRASTSSSGAAFEDNSTTSKKLRFVLSGAVGNNAISVSSTAARTYTLPDRTGTAYIRSGGTTRSVFIPASSFYDVVAAGLNLAVNGTFPDAYLATPMPGLGGTTQVVTSFQIPQDWLSGATWKVHYTNGGTSGNATWWRIKYLSASAGDTLTAAGTDNTGTSTPSTTTHALNITTIGTSSTGIAAGETLRLCVERDSGNASDTNTSTMNFVGVSFEYTADI